jgi:transposase
MSMSYKRTNRIYKPYDPNQSYLLPPDMKDWLPSEHLVYFFLRWIPTMDLSAFDEAIATRKGQPAYHYEMMISLLLYAYSVGVTSSRTIERKTREDVGFRIIAGNQSPDNNTICNFRRKHLTRLSDLFTDFLLNLQTMGFVTLESVALDGTKIQASANSHKSLTYEEMMNREEILRKAVQQRLQEAEDTDQREDLAFGVDVNPYMTPERYQKMSEEQLMAEWDKAKTLRQRTEQEYKKKQLQHQQIKEKAIQAIANKAEEEESEKQNKQKENQKPDGKQPTKPSQEQPKQQPAANSTSKLKSKQKNKKKSANHHRCQRLIPLTPQELIPPPDWQRNRTDFESRMMKSSKGWMQAFNLQGAVDGRHGFMIGVTVTQDGNDQYQLQPMLWKIKKLFCESPKHFYADAGYCSEENLTYLAKEQIDGFVSTGRSEWMSHRKTNNNTKTKEDERIILQEIETESTDTEVEIKNEKDLNPGRTKENGLTNRCGMNLREEMSIKLKTIEGRKAYRKRSGMSEGPFGILKQTLGFTQFSLRGLANVQREGTLRVFGFNLRKLHRLLLRERDQVIEWILSSQVLCCR